MRDRDFVIAMWFASGLALGAVLMFLLLYR